MSGTSSKVIAPLSLPTAKALAERLQRELQLGSQHRISKVVVQAYAEQHDN